MSSRRDPFEEIEELFERLNDGFADLSRELEGDVGGGSLHVDVADAGDELVVAADVPGFDRDDIEVTVKDRRLRISAEQSTEAETGEDREFYRRERSRRSVSRTVTLPVEVDETGATARYENGVLTVELPKRDAADEGTDIEVN